MIQAPFNKTRADKFKLVLTLPDIIQRLDSNEPEASPNRLNSYSFVYNVIGTVVPAQTVKAITAPFGGGSVKVSSHFREPVDSVTFSFDIDNRFRNYFAIHKWLEVINDPDKGTFDADDYKTKKDSRFLKEYASTISLIGMDEYETNVIQWDYIGAFPTEIGPIDYDFRDDGLVLCRAKFEFTKMKVDLFATGDTLERNFITPYTTTVTVNDAPNLDFSNPLHSQYIPLMFH